MRQNGNMDHLNIKENEPMSNTTLLGIDIAKMIFQIYGINASGKVVLKKRLRREQLMEFMNQLPSCTVAMEACGSAHYWARQF